MATEYTVRIDLAGERLDIGRHCGGDDGLFPADAHTAWLALRVREAEGWSVEAEGWQTRPGLELAEAEWRVVFGALCAAAHRLADRLGAASRLVEEALPSHLRPAALA